MKKGKRIEIKLESRGPGGVVPATTMAATVLYSSGDNVTVKDEYGYIREIDANQRDEDGCYVVVA